MSYFDSAYFSSSYFDTGGTVIAGHPHGYWKAWDTRNVEMPPVPAWLAMTERKHRRAEEETLADLLRRQRAWRRRMMASSLALGLENR